MRLDPSVVINAPSSVVRSLGTLREHKISRIVLAISTVARRRRVRALGLLKRRILPRFRGG